MSVLAERLSAQLLAGPPAREPASVVERLLAVQAQNLNGARLAVRARSENVTLADIDRDLTEHRSLLITWLNRGTLHLVRSEDYAWLHALTTPRMRTGTLRRLAQEGVTSQAADRGVAAIEQALADEGPLDRDSLRARLTAAGVHTEGQAFVHLLALASLRGLIVRGPMTDRGHAFVLVRDWLGGVAKPVDRDAALAELARRYLVGHGPASPEDLARWAGLPLGDARSAFAAVASELRRREDGLFEIARRRPATLDQAPLPGPRLLGPFEPVLLGWTSRELVVGGAEHRLISGGVFRAFALVRGRAAATWTTSGNHVELEPFGRLGRGERAALEADGQAVARFLEKPRPAAA